MPQGSRVGERILDFLFMLIRLPFFVALIAWRTGVAVFFIGIGYFLGILIAFVGVPVWVCLLLPGSVVVAALQNDSKVVASFLSWTRKDIIGEAVKWIRTVVREFLDGYVATWQWFVGTKC